MQNSSLQVAFLLIVFSALPQGQSAEALPATMSTEELLLALGTPPPVDAWYFEYRSAATADTASEAHVCMRCAIKAPDLFFHHASHNTELLPWQEDPYQQRLIQHAEYDITERPLMRSFVRHSLEQGSGISGTAVGEPLFALLPWWPLTHTQPPRLKGDQPFVLAEIAACSHYVVRPEQELCQGRWCHVLERSGLDKIWLDAERSLMVRMRECKDSESGRWQRFTVLECEEIHAKTWVPTQVRNEIFESRPDLAAKNQQTLIDATLFIGNWKFNDDVPDELFEFRPQPSTIEFVDAQQFVQVTEGYEYMEFLNTWLMKHIPASRKASWGWEEMVMLVSILLILLQSRRLIDAMTGTTAGYQQAEETANRRSD